MPKHRSTDHIAADDVAGDAETFRAAVRGVRPLTLAPQAPGLQKPKPRARLRKAAVAAAENLDEVMPLVGPLAAEAGASAGFASGEGILSFQRPGVRTQVMRRLRRGLYPIDGELDLHGQSQAAARDRLADFIACSRAARCRCLRIIHGKGYRSGARGPVLKTAVNLWLRRHSDVLAFVSARGIDGGAGAVYVLLRA